MRSTLALLSATRWLVCGSRPINGKPLEAHAGHSISDTGVLPVPIAAGPKALSCTRVLCVGGNGVVSWAPMHMGAGHSVVGHRCAWERQKALTVGNNVRGAPMVGLMSCLATTWWEKGGTPYLRITPRSQSYHAGQADDE